MALTIYGAPNSRTSRVLWLAKELGLQYDHVPVNNRNGDTRKPEHLKLNPNGHVPVIKDGDLVLWESLAIINYLAKKHGGPLAPANAEEAAKLDMWSMWALTEMEPPGVQMLMHTLFLPEDKRSPQALAQAKEQAKAPLAVLEAHLANNDYILGNRFTVADVNLASVVSTMPRVKYDMSAYPKVSAWLQKCNGRPAAAAVREMQAAPQPA
jgi:glutathione S-transferase